jgi:hypothetical protein
VKYVKTYVWHDSSEQLELTLGLERRLSGMGKTIYFQCLTVAVFSLACAAQSSASPDKAREKGSCVEGAYCARTDRKTEVYPEKTPALGPAGSIITDPVFGSRIVRVTDQNTDRVKPGRPVYSPSSAEQNTWNKTSTMFYVTTEGG